MAREPHADAERMARRFYEVSQPLCRDLGVPEPVPWDQVDQTYRQLAIWTFDEMLRSEIVFGGPSLYAEPSV